MPSERESMPPAGQVDPLFDGHLERTILDLTVSERLDWIWEAMQLLRTGRAAARPRESAPDPADRPWCRTPGEPTR